MLHDAERCWALPGIGKRCVLSKSLVSADFVGTNKPAHPTMLLVFSTQHAPFRQASRLAKVFASSEPRGPVHVLPDELHVQTASVRAPRMWLCQCFAVDVLSQDSRSSQHDCVQEASHCSTSRRSLDSIAKVKLLLLLLTRAARVFQAKGLIHPRTPLQSTSWWKRYRNLFSARLSKDDSSILRPVWIRYPMGNYGQVDE
jgi:hypothetical protein